MTELPIVVNMTVDASRTEYDLTAESNLEEIELLNDTVIETGGSHVPVYEGPYTVDAGLNAVTLDTDGKRLTQDVTVNALQGMTLNAPTISVNSSNGQITASVNYTPGYNDTYVVVPTMTPLSTQARATITPTTSEQTAVAKGKYTTGVVKVRAISSPYADVSGVTATAGDVMSGKYFVDSSGVLTLGTGGGGMDSETKDALLECFEHVAWADGDGQIYYNNLLNALYPLQSISAVYTQSGTVLPSTPLDNLKSDLVVTATFEDGTTRTVTNYTLSGTLTVGTSTVTVTYFTETTTFSVTVSASYKYIWKLSDSDFAKQAGAFSWNSTHDMYTNTSTNSTRGRRNIYTDTGVKPYNTTTDDTTFVVTNPPQYPIPIPPDAISVTYTVTPNTQFMGVSLYTYDENSNTYTRTNDIGWKQGSYTQTFTAGSVQYFGMALKYNSAGTSYPTEPSEITITFNT